MAEREGRLVIAPASSFKDRQRAEAILRQRAVSSSTTYGPTSSSRRKYGKLLRQTLPFAGLPNAQDSRRALHAAEKVTASRAAAAKLSDTARLTVQEARCKAVKHELRQLEIKRAALGGQVSALESQTVRLQTVVEAKQREILKCDDSLSKAQMLLCAVCVERPRRVVFSPCRHAVTCSICGSSPQLVRCPICRADIQSREPVFF